MALPDMTTISVVKIWELSHVLSPCHDGLQFVLDRLAQGEDGLSLLQRCLKKASSLCVCLNSDIGVRWDLVAGVHDNQEPTQQAPHVLNSLQSPTLFADQAIQLLGNDLRRVIDDALSEYAGANPPDDQLLEAAGIEPVEVSQPPLPRLIRD